MPCLSAIVLPAVAPMQGDITAFTAEIEWSEVPYAVELDKTMYNTVTCADLSELAVREQSAK